jgi:hypothetical protein
MKYFNGIINEKHRELSKIIRIKEKTEEVKKLFANIHAALNMSQISGSAPNEADALFQDLSQYEYTIIPVKNGKTIAYAVWHIARIEDLTMNILVDKSEQIFNPSWKEKINADINDTGNAMPDDRIIQFSKGINSMELLAYRNKDEKERVR